jgi:hypothetical protein
MKVYKNHFCKCGCGGRPKRGNKFINRHNLKSVQFKKGHRLNCGKNHPMYGKHHSAKAIEKMRNSHLGTHLSEETKEKISKSRLGKNHPRWIDGCGIERHNAVIHSLDRGYPYPIWLNEPFKGASFHHVDKEQGIFIPKKLHKSMYHRLTGYNLAEMNNIAFNWLWNELEQNYVNK